MSLQSGPVYRRLGLIVRLALLISLALSPTSMVVPVSAATPPALTPRPAAQGAPSTASSASTPVPTATQTKKVAPRLSTGCSTDVSKPYPQAVLANSPLVYYRLGDANGPTACDASGNQQDGQYQAGVTFGTTGGLAGDGDAAITNPGIGAGVLQSGATLPAGNAARTVEGWVRSTSQGANDNPTIVS